MAEKIPCKKCLSGESKVVDSRTSGNTIRRRRECLNCGNRSTTYEGELQDPVIPDHVASIIRRLYSDSMKLAALLPVDDPYLDGVGSARRGEPMLIPGSLAGESADLYEQGWRDGSEVSEGQLKVDSERQDNRVLSGGTASNNPDVTMGV